VTSWWLTALDEIQDEFASWETSSKTEVAKAPCGAAGVGRIRLRTLVFSRWVSAEMLWIMPMEPAPRRVFLSHTAELRRYPAGRSFVAAVARAGDAVADMAHFPAWHAKPAGVRGGGRGGGRVRVDRGVPVREQSLVVDVSVCFG
jgi:hypothetical protein